MYIILYLNYTSIKLRESHIEKRERERKPKGIIVEHYAAVGQELLYQQCEITNDNVPKGII